MFVRHENFDPLGQDEEEQIYTTEALTVLNLLNKTPPKTIMYWYGKYLTEARWLPISELSGKATRKLSAIDLIETVSLYEKNRTQNETGKQRRQNANAVNILSRVSEQEHTEMLKDKIVAVLFSLANDSSDDISSLAIRSLRKLKPHIALGDDYYGLLIQKLKS